MKTNEAPSDRVLIPQSITCPRCYNRIDVAKSWDVVRCPCGKVMRLLWWEPR